MRTLLRNVLFVVIYLIAVTTYLWFDPIVTEQTSDLASIIMIVAGVLGLAWANAQVFPAIKSRCLVITARALLVVALYVGLHALTWAYSWKIRPRLGLCCEKEQSANQAFEAIGDPGSPQPQR